MEPKWIPNNTPCPTCWGDRTQQSWKWTWNHHLPWGRRSTSLQMVKKGLLSGKEIKRRCYAETFNMKGYKRTTKYSKVLENPITRLFYPNKSCLPHFTTPSYGRGDRGRDQSPYAWGCSRGRGSGKFYGVNLNRMTEWIITPRHKLFPRIITEHTSCFTRSKTESLNEKTENDL